MTPQPQPPVPPSGEAPEGQVLYNARRDPHYRPYCMRCPTLVRMEKVEEFYWRCRCGAEHDERAHAAASPAPATVAREEADPRCGSQGVDADGDCLRCGLTPDDPAVLDESAAHCPPGFLATPIPAGTTHKFRDLVAETMTPEAQARAAERTAAMLPAAPTRFSTPACPEHGDACRGATCCCADKHPSAVATGAGTEDNDDATVERYEAWLGEALHAPMDPSRAALIAGFLRGALAKCRHLAEAERERNDARAEFNALHERLTTLGFRSAEVRDGTLHMRLDLAQEVAQMFAASFRALLDGAQAANYVECLFGDVHGFLTVTVQRTGRPTPAELRRLAESRADTAEAELRTLRATTQALIAVVDEVALRWAHAEDSEDAWLDAHAGVARIMAFVAQHRDRLTAPAPPSAPAAAPPTDGATR